jgi:hypothetical protein
MRRSSRLALAAAIGLIALSSQTGAAAADSGGSNGAPKSLTHHFPLGSQTLSHTQTARGAATTPQHAPTTTPQRGSTATPAAPRTTPAAPQHGSHGTSSALFLLVIPVLIVAALLIRAVRRRGRRDRPRARVRGRRPARWTRSDSSGARWAYQNTDEVDRQAPPLPVRKRPPPPLPVRERPAPPLPVGASHAPPLPVRERQAPPLPGRGRADEAPPG